MGLLSFTTKRGNHRRIFGNIIVDDTGFGGKSDARIARVVEHENKLRAEIDAIIKGLEEETL